LKEHIRILAILSLIATIGLGGVIVLLPGTASQVEYNEDLAYNQLAIIDDTNGTLSSFYSHYFEIQGDGKFNLTLPAWTDVANISLNATAYEVSADVVVQIDFLSNHESLANLMWGANLNMIHENGSIGYELPLRRYLVSGGIGYSTGQHLGLQLNSTTIEKYNLSWVGVSLESMFHADCNSSYTIQYGVLFDVTVTHEHAIPTDVSLPVLAFLGLGIFSTGMLAAEVFLMNPDE
jgi:hypothetical protein